MIANSADPDQLASSEANWSGSTLFAKQGISGFSRTRVRTSTVYFITQPTLWEAIKHFRLSHIFTYDKSQPDWTGSWTSLIFWTIFWSRVLANKTPTCIWYIPFWGTVKTKTSQIEPVLRELSPGSYLRLSPGHLSCIITYLCHTFLGDSEDYQPLCAVDHLMNYHPKPSALGDSSSCRPQHLGADSFNCHLERYEIVVWYFHG